MAKAESKPSGKAKWTVMVYMAGDNNLYGAALRDITEMAKVGSTKDVNVVVQLDRIEDNLTRRFRITKGGGFKKDCNESFRDHLFVSKSFWGVMVAGNKKGSSG